MSVLSPPSVSSHAKLRFVQRGAIDGPTALTTWDGGSPVDVEGYDYHSARYCDALDVVFLERDHVITTVLDARYVDLTEANQ